VQQCQRATDARVTQPLLDDPSWPKGIEPPGDDAHPSRASGGAGETSDAMGRA